MAVLYSAGREAAQVSRNRKKSKLEELKMLTANARAEAAEKRERLRYLNSMPSRLVGFWHIIPPLYSCRRLHLFRWQPLGMPPCSVGSLDG